MAHQSFTEAVQQVSDFVAQALTRIENNHGEEAELHNIRAYLLNLLELVERSPGLEAACDDLYETAAALVSTRNTDGPAVLMKRKRLLREAYQRFQIRLVTAHPSAKAKHMGLA